MEEVKFRVEHTSDGRVRATSADGKIVVEGCDVGEVRDKLDVIVEETFGGTARIALFIGRGDLGNA